MDPKAGYIPAYAMTSGYDPTANLRQTSLCYDPTANQPMKRSYQATNEPMTSDLTPSAAPTNINELRAKNPEPTHPTRDPTTQPAPPIWPPKADTSAWWEEEEGQEYIQKHFSVKHISKYFRTRSPVSAADIDGWRARELMATHELAADIYGSSWAMTRSFRRS
jgi:hypothetical protein